jgi:hypothetical protein
MPEQRTRKGVTLVCAAECVSPFRPVYCVTHVDQLGAGDCAHRHPEAIPHTLR